MSSRYWIGVVSRTHVRRGVDGGFAQLCHGRAAPLKRMAVGDWLIYYSPRTDQSEGEPLQSFTAIGRITGDDTYPYTMSADFVPFRRAVAYQSCRPSPIAPLLARLSFIKDPRRWGYCFRRGHFEIGRADFTVIAASMGVGLGG